MGRVAAAVRLYGWWGWGCNLWGANGGVVYEPWVEFLRGGLDGMDDQVERGADWMIR